jgi:hypothetical protein
MSDCIERCEQLVDQRSLTAAFQPWRLIVARAASGCKRVGQHWADNPVQDVAPKPVFLGQRWMIEVVG